MSTVATLVTVDLETGDPGVVHQVQITIPYRARVSSRVLAAHADLVRYEWTHGEQTGHAASLVAAIDRSVKGGR